MAEERDFELLDDYLTNRLSEQERSAFEHKLQADPDMQHEYALQKRLIQGIKDARVAELKGMLNQVAIPGNTGNGLGTKILIGTVITVLIAAAGYWYFTRDNVNIEQPKTLSQQPAELEKPAIESPAQVTPQQKPSVSAERPTAEPEKNQTSAGTEHSKPSLAKRPDPLQAPAGTPGADGSRRADIRNASLAVENVHNSEYSFHYQISADKLRLYGAFEEDQYSVLDFENNGKRQLALRYKDNFYLLEPDANEIQRLEPVTDPTLLEMLQTHRAPQ